MNLSGYTGWVALYLFAISFCTPLRSPKLNSLLGGYRSQLKIHHWVGVATVAFMALHLLLLVIDYSSMIHQLIEFSDTSILTGWIALIITALIVGVAFRFRRAPYRRWRRIHLVLITGFIAALLHSLLVLEPGSLLEWGVITLVTVIGCIGIAWILWIPQLPNFGVPYVIDKQRRLRSDLVSQVLVPSDSRERLQFAAGHFVFLRYSNPQFTKVWHPFTVVGFSDTGEFELLVKMRGRDTNLLGELVLPGSVRINGPFGVKFWGADEPQIWIAYGVGIAIFLAAARTMPTSIKAEVRLVYCDKSRENIVFDEEFDGLSARRNNFSWTQYYGEGRDVVEQLKSEAIAWSKTYRVFRICGHPGLQASIKRILIAAGIESNSIILEGVF